MPLQIYNTLTRRKEPFKPLEPGRVRMYVCGPTVYDKPHVGHLRSAYIFEIMRRFLECSGYKVTFVRNVTDVDDKIIQKAAESNPGDLLAETKKVSQYYYECYLKDGAALGIRPPNQEPKATAHIADMIRLIERLLAKGVAYPIQGDVYYRVGRFAGYGKLSGQKREAMLEGVRIDPREHKEDPLDFALWKSAKPGEPSWPSPWGEGRPGWHIECSAMSMRYLGESFDIHGGGRDLIFPHHENEIAQSELATGKPFARHWIHHGMVTMNGHKMSKSLGNRVTLDDYLANKTDPYSKVRGLDVLKLLFLGTHYRLPLDYSQERLKMDEAIWMRFWFLFDNYHKILKKDKGKDHLPENTAATKKYEGDFKCAMDDDFNTPQALTVLHQMLREANKSESEPGVMIPMAKKLLALGNLLGIFSYFEKPFSHRSTSLDAEIAEEIRKRNLARDSRNFPLADEIRQRLLKEKGVELIDGPDGVTVWRIR